LGEIWVIVERREIQEDQKIMVRRTDRQEVQELSVSSIMRQDFSENETSTDKPSPVLSVAYFPAFRTMIEAWISAGRTRRGNEPVSAYYDYTPRRAIERQTEMTIFAREVFGAFVPKLNFPSPIEIEFGLTDQIQRAIYTLAEKDRDLLARAFVAYLVLWLRMVLLLRNRQKMY
jgi:hypothetical protein